MIICDACESRNDVQKVSITAITCGDMRRDGTVETPKEYLIGNASDRWVIFDLCTACRERLARTIKEAAGPQPKVKATW